MTSETAQNYFAQGDAQARQGQFEAAAEQFRAALSAQSDYTDAHSALGNVLLVMGQQKSNDPTLLAEATTELEQAVALEPTHAQAWLNLGKTYKLLNRFTDARQALETSLHHRSDHPVALCWLGATLDKLGEYDQALPPLRRASELKPDYLDPYVYRAFICEKTNRLDEAREAVTAGRKLAPENPWLMMPLAKLERRKGDLNVACDLLQQVLAKEVPMNTRISALEQLGKALDKLGKYDAAFDAFVQCQQAAAQTPAAQGVSSRDVDAILAKIPQVFTPDAVAKWDESSRLDDGIEAPLFLTGFPRSGTTLTEQILAAHPHIVTSHEAPLLSELIQGMGQTLGRAITYPDAVPEFTQQELSILRKDYRSRLESMGIQLKPGQRVLDKLPLNFMHLGFLARLFPQARFLMLLRDPRDCCLSAFTQWFQPNPAMSRTHTLEDTAQLYADMMKVYQHYRRVLPWQQVGELRYEELVEDVATGTRRILDILGLPWDDAVLRYREKVGNQYISTPSYEGVGEPVYRSAIGRWKNYARQFEPVQPILEPYIHAFGYDGEKDNERIAAG